MRYFDFEIEFSFSFLVKTGNIIFDLKISFYKAK